MMIEFEDHCEENQAALLAYLEAHDHLRTEPARPRKAALFARLYECLRLAWAAVSPRCGQ